MGKCFSNPLNSNQPNENGSMLLTLAARNGWTKFASFLIKKGRDINARDRYGVTPLTESISGQRINVVYLLIEKGADLNKTDAGGWSPIHVAVYYRLQDIIKLLFDDI